MAAYLQWLAPQMDQLKVELPERQRQLRSFARQHDLKHDRTPEIVASLALGFEQFLNFAQHYGVILEEGKNTLWEMARQSLIEVALEQGGHQESEEPTKRFLSLLGAVLSSGQAHVTGSLDNREPLMNSDHWGWRDERPLGTHIGWISGDELFLIGDSAFSEVQKMARLQESPLAIGKNTLWKRLREKGLLTRVDHERNTVAIKILGMSKRVLCLSAHALTDT